MLVILPHMPHADAYLCSQFQGCNCVLQAAVQETTYLKTSGWRLLLMQFVVVNLMATCMRTVAEYLARRFELLAAWCTLEGPHAVAHWVHINKYPRKVSSSWGCVQVAHFRRPLILAPG